ncbi:hypothetical protein [Niveispirillum cyanobacteriorum]|uniref:Uncharacterized protein n=1 Tax=Niveispirillum cyanobacteriorum TaxID=1612173 RepID=A0A2K9N987_9PROT|nr:hypothetical protein [Niveispirillum cyanobacteriorum]AUN29700.1 hypothetical protein C0V82_05300 [Niveispirillum cyanobacteriorum]GGE61643.1 hypothetical protein GCM10011317_19160 [Niveispirillum cyanobacteriorum]
MTGADMAMLLAGVFLVGLGLVHSWLGEVKLIGPLLSPQGRSGMLVHSRFARNVLRFAWHLTSLAWWGMGISVAMLAVPFAVEPRLALLAGTGVTCLITGLLILVIGRGRHLAWPVFLAAAFCCGVPLA